MKKIRIALVCGEASGDDLGAGLGRALKESNPQVELAGVTGPKMRDAGVESWLDHECFAVMGYLPALARLPALLASRKQVCEKLVSFRPHVFVGIDAPDLNLGLGRVASGLGIKYIQYVCPSFWRWRKKRAINLARDCALVLALLPFEEKHCAEAKIKAKFVGHRLADELAPDNERKARSRAELGIGTEDKVLALLPGSRAQELRHHTELFVKAARICAARQDGMQLWMAPHEGIKSATFADVKSVPGAARHLLAAADAALIKSGTITLEAALLDCPQVIAYRTSALNSMLISMLIKRKENQHYGLPNLICDEPLVTELLLGEARPEPLAAELEKLFSPKMASAIKKGYGKMRSLLGSNADAKAAAAILEVAGA